MNQINFEEDQTELLDKTDNIGKLANKIKEMQVIQKDIEQNEKYLKYLEIHIIYPYLFSHLV